MRIIAITNQKGGVGKTSTCVNLGAALASFDKRVLIVDADPQANATFALLGTTSPEKSLYDAIVTGAAPLEELVTPTQTPGVELVASDILLSAADITLAAVHGRERLLSRKLRQVEGYDYVLIDTPPSLGVLTVNALTATREVLIPVGVGTFSLLGIKLLEDTIVELRENLELQDLRVAGAVATMYDRTRVAKDTLSALQQHFGGLLYETVIPRNKDVEEANSRSCSVLQYAPKSAAGQAYVKLAKEVVSRG